MTDTDPDVLIHVAGGAEQSAADVALVRPHALRLCPGPAALHEDPVDRLEVDVEVPGLGVAPATQPALVRPLVGVTSQVSLQQGGGGEVFITGGTLQGNLEGVACRGGWGHSRGGGGHSLER